MLRRLNVGIFAIFTLLIIGCGTADVPPPQPTPALETPTAQETLPPTETLPPQEEPTEAAPGETSPAPRDPDAAGAQDGDTVTVHYTGRLQDGEIFDSSEGGAPLEFTLGQGQLIPGFEQGVRGMEAGQTATLNIPAEEAYGPHQEDLVFEMPREELPPDLDLEVGMQVQGGDPGGPPTVFTVVDITDTTVTLDANHPLAGEDLTFDIEVVEVN